MEDPLPCPPDRPWAFREKTPPLVVYRGTFPGPGFGHISGVPFDPLFDPPFLLPGPCCVNQPFWPKTGFFCLLLACFEGYCTHMAKRGQNRPALRFPNNFWKNVSARDAFPYVVMVVRRPQIIENHSIGHPARSGEFMQL